MKRTPFLMICYALGAFALTACGQEPQQQAAETPTPSASTLPGATGKILFQSDRDGDFEIYVMNVDGSELTQLTDNAAADEYPTWSPDGTQIAFTSNRDGNYNIYVMNADGGNPRRLTDNPRDDGDPMWSPDGKRIAFSFDEGGDYEIYVINADGAGLERFTDTIGKNILPAFSPDGKRLAYTGNRYLGWNVYVTNLDKTDDKRVTDGHGACRQDWSPDSAKLAYVSQKADGKGDIWIMNPDGSEKTRLTTDDHNYDYYPDWSPDGKFIAYAKTSDKEKGNWELWIMTADGSRHAQITNHPAQDKFPDWKQ